MNHTIIAGHLGRDPEVRFTSNGTKVTTLVVACNQRKGQKEETMWVRVTVWGDNLDHMIQHLKKGSPVLAMGSWAKPEIYTDKEGKSQVSVNMTATSLSFSPFGKPKGAGGEEAGTNARSYGKPNAAEDSFKAEDDIFSEEEIPF
ncbi:MAG: hypothetical protein A3F09_03940 [Chlamydiae bacterium RIFCSPHIGHO2_12_FULL_49_11]|nr:MAG: hypothetical protein A3F09_03940 [Chlamydiae bacterium RIFCSPHIGHO2_12_FULL_49_11]